MNDPARQLLPEFRVQAEQVVSLMGGAQKWPSEIFQRSNREDVLHLLGEVCRSTGSPEEAVSWILQPLPYLERRRPFDSLCNSDLASVWAIIGPVLYD